MNQPSLHSLTLDPAGQPLSFRVWLPPQIRARRPSLPIRVAAVLDAQVVSLEKLSASQPYWLTPPHLLAAMLLESWCGGRLASLLTLTADQLTQLLQPLEGEAVVFWVNQPDQALVWENGRLPDVHPWLTPTPAVESPPAATEPRPAVPTAVIKDLEPMTVDGSSHFLAITLPSRESEHYPEVLALLKQSGFKLEPSNRKWWLRDRHRTLQFLADHWTQLEQAFGARFTSNFRERTAELKRAEMHLQVDPRGGDFEMALSLEAPGVPRAVFTEALTRGMAYVESGEQVVILDAGVRARFAEARRRLSGEETPALTPRWSQRVRTVDLAAVEECLEPLGLAGATPADWRQRSAGLRDLSRLERPPLPAELGERLRPYQWVGVAWLWHLCRHQLGGILADEMGLGKTIQALALLACLKAQNPDSGPALVVCPAALVENWRREAAAFVPWLKVLTHHGSGRSDRVEVLETADLLITSYGVLVRDRALFESLDLAGVVGDEAQLVKNRRTQYARSLRQLRADRRFLLTGTPVENHLDDLRSLFEFILPGYLPPMPAGVRFEERTLHRERLQTLVAPYILRRCKNEVAPELPEKIEQVIYCPMQEDQQGFYREMEVRARQEVMALELQAGSEQQARVAAFRELLRLRQVCIDPRLTPEGAAAEVSSAKLETFQELLQECLDGGHRVLVFSQFTSMLALLREQLEADQVPLMQLDGGTRNRTELVDQFNRDPSIPVLLISLRAGGVGLNLTGADTVIHFDPWWNPAVMAQATDRAHRIGQTRVVNSYQLICPGTVEERVLALQASKRDLLRGVFEASEASQIHLGIQDLRQLLGEGA